MSQDSTPEGPLARRARTCHRGHAACQPGVPETSQTGEVQALPVGLPGAATSRSISSIASSSSRPCWRIGLRRLRHHHIEALYDQLLTPNSERPALSAKTVYEIHLVIRGSLDEAVRRGLLTRNVALLARSPRLKAITKTEAQSWTAEQFQQFLRAAAGHQLFPLLWLAAMTGMRRNEVLGLKWDDIDFKKRTISLNRGLVAVGYELQQTRGKTRNARRPIDLDDTTLTVLAGWKTLRAAEFAAVGIDTNEWVFTDGDREPIHPHALSQTFERIARRAGVPLSGIAMENWAVHASFRTGPSGGPIVDEETATPRPIGGMEAPDVVPGPVGPDEHGDAAEPRLDAGGLVAPVGRAQDAELATRSRPPRPVQVEDERQDLVGPVRVGSEGAAVAVGAGPDLDVARVEVDAHGRPDEPGDTTGAELVDERRPDRGERHSGARRARFHQREGEHVVGLLDIGAGGDPVLEKGVGEGGSAGTGCGRLPEDAVGDCVPEWLVVAGEPPEDLIVEHQPDLRTRSPPSGAPGAPGASTTRRSPPTRRAGSVAGS